MLNQLWKEFKELFERDYKPILLKIGLPEHRLELPNHVFDEPDDDNIKATMLEDCHKFLKEQIDVAVQGWKNIRVLQTEEAWDMYELHGFEDFRECKLLHNESKNVCKTWGKRPRLMKGKSYRGPKTTEKTIGLAENGLAGETIEPACSRCTVTHLDAGVGESDDYEGTDD